MVALGRVDPEVATENGLIPASRIEILTELKALFDEWEPRQQAFFMKHGCNFLALAGLLPGYAFSKKFSKILSGVTRARGKWLPIVLPMMVPGALCGLTHEFFVTHDIYLQETRCSVCLESRATALQVTLGAWLPFISSLIGTVILGQQINLKWVPRNRSAFFIFCKNVAARSTPIIAGATLFQMTVAGTVTYLELKSYRSVLVGLEERVAQNKADVDSKLGHRASDSDLILRYSPE